MIEKQKESWEIIVILGKTWLGRCLLFVRFPFFVFRFVAFSFFVVVFKCTECNIQFVWCIGGFRKLQFHYELTRLGEKTLNKMLREKIPWI